MLWARNNRELSKRIYREFVGEGDGTFQGEAFPGGFQVQRLGFLNFVGWGQSPAVGAVRSSVLWVDPGSWRSSREGLTGDTFNIP